AHAGACKARRTRELVVKPARQDDVLQREQLRGWFAEVRKQNPVAAAYLQTLLLVGARREELGGLRWVDIDFAWRSMRIGDKVEGSRVVPLTDHVAALLLDLKARNETPPPTHRILHGRRVASDLEGWSPSPWVFSSKTSASGRLAAGLPPLTLHGLRRSFGTLAEWTEAPVGVVAQVMGHQPSAVAEKHYRRRPLDLLRQWHQRIEGFILAEAGIEPAAAHEPNRPALALVRK
ncbi:MAG: tyrosine-type recombinase/integrase, partial [Burkholderiales bacterium]|nr:tyrosine-type recombinase/integrase [Burkholderiales bacterium]